MFRLALIAAACLSAGCCSAPEARRTFGGSFTSVRTFPGLLGYSPGLDNLAADLRRLAPEGSGPILLAHSAGCSDAVSSAKRCGTLVLLEPWPVCVVVPPGPKLVIVAGQRPAFVSASCPVVSLWVPGIPIWGHVDVCSRLSAARLASVLAEHASDLSAGDVEAVP